MNRQTYVWDDSLKKMIPKHEYQNSDAAGLHIINDIEPFKSPVTGELITSRSQLRQHNKQHGVTDSRDYSPEYMANKRKSMQQHFEREQKQQRINAILETLRG